MHMYMHVQVADGSIDGHMREREESGLIDNEQVTGLKFKVVEAQARASQLAILLATGLGPVFRNVGIRPVHLPLRLTCLFNWAHWYEE